jgi:EmrB/QacA subfamily drug resistance transporter
VSVQTSTVADQATGSSAGPDPRRWWALAIIAIAQLMVVLDATVVNIALPKASDALNIAPTDRQWVVTAYTLTFGGLLLLGGRVADYWGRKRAFVLGIAGFAVASALGGLAQNGATLFLARGLQGVFGALLAPASLALLTVLFTDVKERAKAFGVYGAIAGGGSAVGLVLGGVLTEYANWRWCLLVNIPVAIVAIVAALPLVSESKAPGDTRYDVPGAVLVTGGLISLVFGFTKAIPPQGSWHSTQTIVYLSVGVVMLVGFVLVQMRSANPLVPLRILLDRNRGGANLSSLLVGTGLIGAFLFLSYYLQYVLHYTPVKAGVASLPVTVGVLVAAAVATPLMPKIGPKPLMATGAFVGAIGMLLLTRLQVDSSFTTHLLPAQLLLGLGLGLMFVPLGNVALMGVSHHDAGAASATLNATQQVGGALGTALLSTFALTATSNFAASHPPASKDQAAADLANAVAQVHGYKVAFGWGAGFLALAGVIVLVFIKASRKDMQSGAGAGAVHIG